MRVKRGSVQRRDVHAHLVQAEDPAADQGGDQQQGHHQPSRDGRLLGSSMFDATLVDGRAVELDRSMINKRLIDHAGLSNPIHCKAPVRLYSTLSRYLGQENAVWNWRDSSTEGDPTRFEAVGGEVAPQTRDDLLTRSSIVDVGVWVRPNRHP